MSINYYAIKKRNPQDETDEKWYAQQRIKGFVTLDQLTEAVAEECTVTEHDVKAILSSLQQHIIANLQNNRSVRLGDLGSFHIKTNCYAVDDESELSTSNLKGLRVHFSKSARLLKQMNVARCSFRKISV